jgi:predicted alpha/beta-hydrolase family hydrolase
MSLERWIIDRPEAAARSNGSLRDLLLVLWHGAGGDIGERSLTAVAHGFAAQGAVAVRARFPYRLAGRRAPDRMPLLIEAARETVGEARRLRDAADRHLILGGRSMGGRVASVLVAQGLPADGLLFLSYPLHPAGKPEKLRDEHLYVISCPMLFVEGDRDPLCDLALLRPVLKKLGGRVTLSLFPGADHSFRQVASEDVVAACCAWAAPIAKKPQRKRL